jgi:hypothetical protein
MENAKRVGKSISPEPRSQPACLVRRTRDSILERVKGRAMQPCGTSNPLVIGGGIRPGEQRTIESELNAYFACLSLRVMEDRLARSANSWGGLLTGILWPLDVAQTHSSDKAWRTAYPEPREDESNRGG